MDTNTTRQCLVDIFPPFRLGRLVNVEKMKFKSSMLISVFVLFITKE